MRLRLVDLDDNATLARAATEFGTTAQWLDCKDLGPGLRLWTTHRAMRSFAKRLNDCLEPEGKGPILTLFGSGDYHHLTTALLAKVHEPFTLVHFDNHPDWVRFAPRYHCGSWVNRALELPTLARIITIGPCSDDLDWPELKGGNLAAIERGRLELYPWRHGPSAVLRQWSETPCFRQHGRRLFWRSAGGESWPAFLGEIYARIPTDAVWFTIDKDVLRPSDAGTNWDQGEMPIEALCEGIAGIARGKRVLGADICGDYSPPIFGWNFLKRFESWQDHPPAPKTELAERNVAVNRILIATLREAMT